MLQSPTRGQCRLPMHFTVAPLRSAAAHAAPSHLQRSQAAAASRDPMQAHSTLPICPQGPAARSQAAGYSAPGNPSCYEQHAPCYRMHRSGRRRPGKCLGALCRRGGSGALGLSREQSSRRRLAGCYGEPLLFPVQCLPGAKIGPVLSTLEANAIMYLQWQGQILL